MYKLTTEQSFDAAHFLAGYDGKCKNIHGHRWRVVVTVSSDALRTDSQQRGMLVDFGEIKGDLKKIVGRFDHALVIENGSLKAKTLEALQEEDFRIVVLDFRPTAENLAYYFFAQMKEKGYPVKNVEVYETPKNCAVYEE